MAWYDEAVFYHIYPLGLLDAPKQNPYGEPVHRLRNLIPWIDHIKDIGCNAIYIGPLFESVGHGYETTDYKKLDSRLGDNEDLKNFVKTCHAKGIKVIFDGVFNHVGRDFFAFKDLQERREDSRYKYWFCNVNFWGNNEYNDGFSYDNWGGYNLLVKLNQRHPEVIDYISDVVKFWVSEFDVDGIRLDAADVLDFDFMKRLRDIANTVKPDFWLMGEVIHGDYNRWANEGTLHSVTNYHLHKAFFSGHNDHNYFEIAHTVKRLNDVNNKCRLYSFVDNHDVERIYTKLNNKEHFIPTHVLLYGLPGIPSLYYGSEFAIEGKKERYSDDSIRPALDLADFKDAVTNNRFTNVIAKLGAARTCSKALAYGDYREIMLTNRQYAFSRNWEGEHVLVAVNNDDNDFGMSLPADNCNEFIGVISGQRVTANNGSLNVTLKGNSGEIWVPYTGNDFVVKDTVDLNAQATSSVDEASKISAESAEQPVAKDSKTASASKKKSCKKAVEKDSEKNTDASNKNIDTTSNSSDATDTTSAEATDKAAPSEREQAFEEGRIAGLQEAILAIMSKNGPITDQMRNDVYNQTHIPSLINWVKSFR